MVGDGDTMCLDFNKDVIKKAMVRILPFIDGGHTSREVTIPSSVAKIVAMQHRWLIKYEKNSGGTY